MLQTTVIANQNGGTLFTGDFARGYASHGLGATSLTVKKKRIKKTHNHLDTGNLFCAYAYCEHKCLPTRTKALCLVVTLYCPHNNGISNLLVCSMGKKKKKFWEEKKKG